MKFGHITWKRDIVLGAGITVLMAVKDMAMANVYVLPPLESTFWLFASYVGSLAILDLILPNEWTED